MVNYLCFLPRCCHLRVSDSIWDFHWGKEEGELGLVKQLDQLGQLEPVNEVAFPPAGLNSR